ncbi:cobalamin biosynthesis protein [Streptomyces sp. NPDC050161]|uniref:cobalamin biosynthesis protein n=1 Tax=Streptomyces sp. NPDC050161 TaxID=3365604 RepID=UPI0037A56038
MTAERAARGLCAGVGAGRGVPVSEVVALVRETLARAGCPVGALAALATVETKTAEPGLVGAARLLGVPLRGFPAGALAAVRVPAPPSATALAATGTPSVAEAAALLAAGPGAELLVGKRKSAPSGGPARATCAVAAPADGDRGRTPAAPSAIVMASPTRPGCGPALRTRNPYQGDSVPTPPALLIAGPGTRDDGGAQALRTLLDVIGARHPEVPVAGGFTGSAPSGLPLGAAVDALAGQGVTRIAAVPLLPDVYGGVPAELARAAGRHPDLAYVCGQDPGGHPLLLDALERQLDEALGGGARRPGDRARTTVLLVGGGSGDPYANADVARMARLLWEGRGLAGVETAFLRHTAPDVPAGLDRCRVLGGAVPGPGAPGRIVVLPAFPLSCGAAERLRLQVDGWQAAHPETEVTCAEPAGPGPELADALVQRYREVLAAGIPAAARGHRVGAR